MNGPAAEVSGEAALASPSAVDSRESRSLHGLLCAAARVRPHSFALIATDGSQLTYLELLARVERLAAELRRRGVTGRRTIERRRVECVRRWTRSRPRAGALDVAERAPRH